MLDPNLSITLTNHLEIINSLLGERAELQSSLFFDFYTDQDQIARIAQPTGAYVPVEGEQVFLWDRSHPDEHSVRCFLIERRNFRYEEARTIVIFGGQWL